MKQIVIERVKRLKKDIKHFEEIGVEAEKEQGRLAEAQYILQLIKKAERNNGR